MSQRQVTRKRIKAALNARHAKFKPQANSTQYRGRRNSRRIFRQRQQTAFIESNQDSDVEETDLTPDEHHCFALVNNANQSDKDQVVNDHAQNIIEESSIETVLQNQELLSTIRDLERENLDLRQNLSTNARPAGTDELLQSFSRFLNTSQAQVPTSSVGPCVPQDNTTLQVTDWEVWRKRFESWLNVHGITESERKQEFFNIMSGDQLYLVLRTAPALQGSCATFYEQTVEQLNAVFKARANNFSLKTSFRSTTQEKSEKNVDYLSRVMQLALRIWERSDPVIDGEILLCVAVNGQPKLQEFTMRLCNEAPEKQKYENLVNQARLLDNLSDLIVKNSSCSILAIDKKESYTPRNTYSGYKASAQESKPSKLMSKEQGTEKPRNCYRCGSSSHLSFKCDKFGLTCEYCGIKGHIVEVCRKKRRLENSAENYENTRKKQQTEVATEDNSIENKV